MENITEMKLGKLIDSLAEYTDHLTQMRKEFFNDEVYTDCKEKIERITAEIRDRKSRNQTVGFSHM